MLNSIFLMILAHGSEHHAEPTKAVVKALNHDIVTLHPMLVHLPIGLLVAAVFFELLFMLRSRENLRNISRATFFLGCASALVVLGSGFLADNELGHGYAGHDLAHSHRNWMIGGSVVWVFATVALYKFKAFVTKLKLLHLLLYAVTAVVFFFGAHIGGELVYEHGVGVKPLMKNATRRDH